MNKRKVGDDLSVCILNIFLNELYPSSTWAVSKNLFWKLWMATSDFNFT